VSRSEELSRSFYAQLGADGLANRTGPEWDERIVDVLIEMLPEHGRVLDAGCGYGRITLPLARAGYAVHGIDLSPGMVESARADAEGLGVDLVVASMMNLPYASESFDAVICLWSAFNELLEEDEQIRTIAEMWRVLDRGGFALIEGRPYEEPSAAEIETGMRRGPEHRIEWSLVEDILNPHFRHDERSLQRICEIAGVKRFQVFERELAGRKRLCLRVDKPAA
jgi:SAM-dependent methyltransferase